MPALVRVFALAALIAGAGACRDATAPGPLPAPPPPASVPDGLWTVSGDPAAILRLAPAQLGASGALDPATRLTTPSVPLNTLVGVAFAADGTLWLASADDSRLLGFAPPALGSSGSRPATTVIEPVQVSLSAPSGLAFDAAHRLWVANHDNGTLVRFDPDQLAAGGMQAPAVVIAGVGHPTALAFDGGGGLWVSDNEAHTVSQYRAPLLAGSGSPAPSVVVSSHFGSPLINPDGLAFDAEGRLWVANLGTRTVVAFGGTQLLASGSPLPQVVLSATPGSFTLPVGLAFGPDGGLWVVGATGIVVKLEQGSLSTSGAPLPSVRLTISGHSLFWSGAFWPKTGGLPLF